MTLRRFLLALLTSLAVPWAATQAAEKGTVSTREKALRQLSATIDRHIDARLSSAGITSADRASDAEFFRRAWLHLAGSIPPVSDVREFLDETADDKRDRAVKDLLSRPSFVRNLTTFWRKAWLPEADADPMVLAQVPALENWLRKELLRNRRYDELVRDLIAVPVTNRPGTPAVERAETDNGPIAFLLAKDAKPENLAAGTARAFLAIRLDCAQCHDHPFDRWKRDQFWSFAAFFAGLERDDMNPARSKALFHEVADRRELMIPETERLVSAAFLDGKEPKSRSRGGRQLLSEWITSPQNPYFAKAAVNRLWGHLFGVGLVDPVDDFSSANAPSHPELLEELAAAFIEHQFDVKFLLEAVMRSQTYQRTSRQNGDTVPPQLLAHMLVQGMSAEQLVQSLSLIVGMDRQNRPETPGVQPDELARIFSRPGESPVQRQTTILQALTLMNGDATASAVDVQQGPLLAAVMDFPGLTPAERIDTLFLATLSRPPTAEETSRLTKHISTTEVAATACGDILWALLNSAEFGCNH